MSSSIKRQDIPLEVRVNQRLEHNKNQQQHAATVTIFRVPAHIRKANKSLYEPNLVSIGPYYYHLRKDRLQAMEDQKWRLLGSFLDRNNNLSSETCINKLRSLEKSTRQYYSEYIGLKPDEFIEMLLLDGCFILELFFQWHTDPDNVNLFKEGWSQTTIFSDLLLFENQIPFVVIETLYEIVKRDGAENINGAFLSLLPMFLMEDDPWSLTSPMTWPEKIDHLLDLYHQFLIVPSLGGEEPKLDLKELPLCRPWLIRWITPTPDQQSTKLTPQKIPCATDLHQAGIRFKKKQSPKNYLDVNFGRGKMEIPLLQINYSKKVLLTNLVHLEKHKPLGYQNFTSYVALMVSLINTKEDVALLQHAGVIDNMLYSHQEAAVLFNQIAEATSFVSKNHHLVKLFIRVRLYYYSNWNRRWALLIKDYFNSPWAVISVIAAVILLSLSGLQTFYTVYPYYVPGKSGA